VTACTLQAELPHETRKRTSQLQPSIPGPQSFGCHPDEYQPWIGPVGKASAAQIRNRERYVAIGTRVLLPRLRAVRQSRLNEHSRHKSDFIDLDGGLAAQRVYERERTFRAESSPVGGQRVRITAASILRADVADRIGRRLLP
jgi:hypothetical protein